MGSAAKVKPTVLERLRQLSLPLLAGVVIGLVWANVAPEAYHSAIHYSPFGEHHELTLHFFANEVLMVFFFGIATKEIAEACLPGGALNPLRKAVNPLLATLGGILGPVGVYLGMTWLLGAPQIARGWGIPTATDIALAWLVARLLFGARHAAVSFLLLLAVADDAGGMAIIAIFYPDPNHPTAPAWLGLLALGMVVAWVMKRRGVTSPWPYVLVSGALSWIGLYLAHLHPALALVPVVPFMPNRGWDEGLFAECPEEQLDTLNRFEAIFKTPVDFGLLTFGLANAGVRFTSIGPATWAVLVALLVGKTVGITAFSMAARALGFDLPRGMTPRTLALAALVAGMGLTVALFVAGVAFTDEGLQGAAKMGALLSSVAAPLALLAGKLVGVKRKETVDEGEPEPAINPSGRISLRGSAQAPREDEMDLGAPAAREPSGKSS